MEADRGHSGDGATTHLREGLAAKTPEAPLAGAVAVALKRARGPLLGLGGNLAGAATGRHGFESEVCGRKKNGRGSGPATEDAL